MVASKAEADRGKRSNDVEVIVPPVDHDAIALRVEPSVAVVACGREVEVDEAGGAREQRAHGGGVPGGAERVDRAQHRVASANPKTNQK